MDPVLLSTYIGMFANALEAYLVGCGGREKGDCRIRLYILACILSFEWFGFRDNKGVESLRGGVLFR